MADCIAAESYRKEAVTGKTQKDQDRAFNRWVSYAESVGLGSNPFLDGFSRPQRIKLMGAFAVAMREGRFSGPAHDVLAESTIRSAISYVASTFRENDRSNPTRDEDGDLGRLLSRLFRAFRKKDPKEKQQKALPASVLLETAKLQLTETQRAVSQLSIGAFYFACRSCEYVKVQQAEMRRTDILRLRNIQFRRYNRVLRHDNPELEYADCVSLTFEMQKKDEKHDTVTQYCTEHEIMCPVRAWAAVVKRIRGYPGANSDTPVSAVWRNGRIQHITSQDIIDGINRGAEAVGWDLLGLNKGDFGTHSIRSGGAMAMYLDEIPIYTIMLIGRWSSDAWLRYIRKQVDQFSNNVARRMNKHMHYRHLPVVEDTDDKD